MGEFHISRNSAGDFVVRDKDGRDVDGPFENDWEAEQALEDLLRAEAQMRIDDLMLNAESGDDWAEICRLEALAVEGGPMQTSSAPRENGSRRVPAQRNEGTTSVVASETAWLAFIDRAARDPAIDVTKMRQLIDMKLSIEAHAAERAFDAAMATAQAAMRPIATDADNPQTRSRYASFAALDRAVRGIYTEHGFSLSFSTGEARDGEVLVLCRVAHIAGHARDCRVPVPADGKGARGGDVMSRTHATGAAITYGRRYLLAMIFNLAVERDDDGNGAGALDDGRRISNSQAAELKRLLRETNTSMESFCRVMKIGDLRELPARDYELAVETLEDRRRTLAERQRRDARR
jgi:hypothetical protein